MTQPEIPSSVRSALREFKEVLLGLYGKRFHGLYLYGSHARGLADENSDVDVLIALEGQVNPFHEIDRFSGALSDICFRYDILIAAYPVPEIWLEERKSALFENIRREGILL